MAAGKTRAGTEPVKAVTATLLFITGVLSGAIAITGYWYWQHATTEVWVNTQPMHSDNGIIIPPGTSLTLERWMPEGFATLNLGINVEGESLDAFRQHTEQKSFLRKPYFVEPGND